MSPSRKPDTAAPEDQTPDNVDDVPVFAPADGPTAEPVEVIDIPDWLAQNYRELIADPDRNDSFSKLAGRSEGQLAAWARREAALAGENVTPTDAAAAGGESTREGTDQ